MRIMAREKGNAGWVPLDSVSYSQEAELQALLAASPSIIPLTEIQGDAPELCVAVREFGLPGAGATDIIAFNRDGDIAIVECKLAANQEAKRKVIGQILEYGAYLWQMSYEDVNERVRVRRGRDLAELVREQVSEDWDEEDFREAVSECLSGGRFYLVIAVDEINEELARIIRYVNEGGKMAFSLHALEMRLYRSDQTEVLVPHLYGVPEHEAPLRRHRWTREEFRRVAAERLDEGELAVVEDLLDWAEGHTNNVSWGTGAKNGSFTFCLRRNETRLSVFSVFTDGMISLNFGALGAVGDSELQAFHTEVTSIYGLQGIVEFRGKWPMFRIRDVFVGKPASLEAFKEAVMHFGKSTDDEED